MPKSTKRIEQQPIKHVVTYVSTDGSFGGPLAVAIAQVTELARQGQKVDLVAGWDGKQKLTIPGVTVRLFRAKRLWPGFTGLVSPALWWHLISSNRRTKFLHIHMGRDLMSLGSALIAMVFRRSYLVQTHGMVQVRRRTNIKALDFLVTSHILRNAVRVLTLTRAESMDIRKISKDRAHIDQISNGVRNINLSDVTRNKSKIIFLARLHPRKRVMAFAEMCKILLDHEIIFHASVIGPDEGDLDPLLAYIRDYNLAEVLDYQGSIKPGESIATLASAGVFVLPSYGEIFPMTVLEALVARTLVVTTHDSGLAPILDSFEAAIITDGSPASLASGVMMALSDEKFRKNMINRGSEAVRDVFGIENVVEQLKQIYDLSE
ncbi:glycosyltransferase [Arthrobacter sp. STN4]|uniref:glycosyltransferase n=1 Tax=Arthrobacter sp. STN4 TaxID=2923276 RepID=UPI00211A4730|nr:glycosyltransferase [Arthrobacter sp. STN4]MCQ9163664.1 glycosyltransferase [Arthrobacter sp. STN4]